MPGQNHGHGSFRRLIGTERTVGDGNGSDCTPPGPSITLPDDGSNVGRVVSACPSAVSGSTEAPSAAPLAKVLQARKDVLNQFAGFPLA